MLPGPSWAGGNNPLSGCVAAVGTSEDTGRQHLCSLCSRGFVSRSKLERHLRKHTGERPYRYLVTADIEPGMLLGQDSEGGIHRLHHCVTTVHTNKGNREEHAVKQHHQCSHCHKGFAKRCHLVVHLPMHTGEHPYKCSHSSSSFAQKGSLVVHLSTHTGDRPYHCNYCSSSFAQESAVTRTLQHLLDKTRTVG
ncbi:zinc finger protein 711-like [Amblyomma americanum]